MIAISQFATPFSKYKEEYITLLNYVIKQYHEKNEVENTLMNLTDLEKIGIVEREIGNLMDEPVQTWRTRVS